ncbi:HAD family phosphatase [Micromonospora sp. KC721]|uniref:HAD family hydrolase n=1 Tax=Micromonospora sp. KC721 TaxID=2530380 RepID=UPI001047CFAE|nr:haloacid dehalogenase-like hydrolase [Micromonospora sp. KC721]TDB79170.1 haloacid dehalogenase [Micromonospora sp. KC721]
MRGVVFFDVDGTLVPNTSSGQHLAELLGHAEVVREAEAGYAAGVLSNEQVCVLDARGWASRSPAEVRGFLKTLPLVEGIAETVDWCRRHRLAPILATLAWDVVGEYLCDRFGFERSCGPRLEVVRGRYSGDVAAYFDEIDKRDFAVSVATELGVQLWHCAAIGDSRSDLPLFAEVGMAVAFNATAGARSAAHTSADGSDLRDVLPLLAGWLESMP